ncbi:MAG: carboxypeptidase regulatory-like domain-containing protein [Myxococcales bacterium]|nr:carboxypeptidase regulatory-like domain-containing protein [Myxococcales bacterium]
MQPYRVALCAFCLASLVHCGAPHDPMDDWHVGPGPLAQVSGRAFVFGPSDGQTIEGATVSVAEAPEYATTVRADGTFTLEAPSGAPVSLLLTKPGFHPTQTAAHMLDVSGLDQVGFQVPTDDMFALLALIVELTADPETCQIATTVSRKDTEPYGGAALGEPGVTVAIDPPLPAEAGPIYFAYLNEAFIVPDRTLTETTVDGGVLFLNVPPGEYTLTATKVGKTFTEVTIRCVAGRLVNAAPPRGLQEL